MLAHAFEQVVTWLAFLAFHLFVLFNALKTVSDTDGAADALLSYLAKVGCFGARKLITESLIKIQAILA